ncbi:MAG: serine hydrolase [Pyrinomonadaceae bacterium]
MLQRSVRASLFLLLLFVTPLGAQEETLDARLKEIDEYAARMREDWRVPGFALAIVKDDRVVLSKGYGVREMGKPEAVDADTLFAVASNTKAFTAAALAMLVDEGKVKWDDPVMKYLPAFQLSDPYVTRELTVRDLLSHRSGLATFAGDLLWYNTTYDRAEILRRARFLKPVSSFRSAYGYQNIMFLAAGEVVSVVSGKSWDQFIKERFFGPLGMKNSTTTIRELPAAGGNVATPHNEMDGKLRTVRYSNSDAAGGAAAINSSARDMAQWLRLQLGRGRFEGRLVFAPARSREMWTPHTIIPISELGERVNPTRHFRAYGLGWSMSDYHGRKVIEHGGALDGMLSQTGMIPEENLGIVVLSNSETALPSTLMLKVFDVFLGVPKRDWSAEALERTRQAKAASEAAAKSREESRAANTKPSLALASYAGAYAGDFYGEARVAEESGKLVLRLAPAPNFVGDLEHWQFDTFRVKWRDSVNYPFPRGFVTFVLDAQGQVEELKIDVPNPDFDFKELELKRVRPGSKD